MVCRSTPRASHRSESCAPAATASGFVPPAQDLSLAPPALSDPGGRDRIAPKDLPVIDGLPLTPGTFRKRHRSPPQAGPVRHPLHEADASTVLPESLPELRRGPRGDIPVDA